MQTYPRNRFTLIFDDLQAAVGPGVPTSQASEFCDVVLNFAYTPGWQFGTASTTWRGFAGLDAGVKGTSSVKYTLTNGMSILLLSLEATQIDPLKVARPLPLQRRRRSLDLTRNNTRRLVSLEFRYQIIVKLLCM
jgi:hypothetical protein